jgi:NAD(P)-dependent dehydrogenase (short-subunit alcohol dehydrogenase family)
MHITGKHIVITGAASGIGRAMARRFKAEGAASLVLADLDADGLGAVARELGATGIVTDVADENAVLSLVTQAEAIAPIDLLCSNAGIAINGGVDVANDDWRRIIDINLMSHIYAARAALPAMLERGEGYLLQTASAAGLLSQIGSAPYAVTKHAAVALAEWLAITHGDAGIIVSALCPQAVRTNMTSEDATGVASIDGLMEPEELCDSVVTGLRDETFLILPHTTVATYIQRKANDYDRWLGGMRRLQQRFDV